jgi:ATP-dependent Clp protease protease subunit
MNHGQEFRKYAVKHLGMSGLTVDGYVNHTVENMTRAIIEERPMNFREVDVFSRLMADRIIFFGMPVDDQIANIVVAQLLFLESADPKKDILMYINSPGGSVTAGMAIYDTMQFIKPDITTIVMGQTCSMGSLLAQAGSAGKRLMLPHARHMIHQPSGGARGQATDMEIQVREILAMKKALTEIYVKHNSAGKTYEQLAADMERDYFMSAEEARIYGLVDRVIDKR